MILTEKVSIVMAVYNAEEYLAESLDSLLHQTYTNIEIICVDDGSTDESAAILKNYMEKDARIKILRQENLGAGVARNKGFANISGAYVIFLDADDLFDETLIERLLLRAIDTKADIVICDERAIDGLTGEEIIFSGFFPIAGKVCKSAVFSAKEIPQFILNVAQTHVWDKLYRTDFVRKNELRFQSSRIINDALFCQMGMALAGRIAILDEKLVRYRINTINALSRQRDKNWRCAYDMLEELARGLQERDLYDALEQSYINYAAYIVAIYLMCSITDEGAFCEAYGYYQKKAKQQFQFLRFDKSYFYDEFAFEILSRMETLDCMAFLCSRLSDLKKMERQVLDLNLQILGWQSEVKRIAKVVGLKKWHFPIGYFPRKARIAIYGYGEVGRDFCEEIEECGLFKLVCVADRNYRNVSDTLTDVVSPEILAQSQFDFLLIAIREKAIAKEVGEELLDKQVERKKLVWFNPETWETEELW